MRCSERQSLGDDEAAAGEIFLRYAALVHKRRCPRFRDEFSQTYNQAPRFLSAASMVKAALLIREIIVAHHLALETEETCIVPCIILCIITLA